MKTCSKCGTEKPLDEFHRDARKADGVRATCKACYRSRGICSIDGCSKAIHSAGMCAMHYHRDLRHGDVNHRREFSRSPLADRLAGKYQIDPTTGCWNWTACTDKHGYGQIALGGKHGGQALAHRVSYELHVGQIPDGMMVLHSCDNPACINPAHLRIGTQIDNMADMASRDRGNQWGHKTRKEHTCA